MKVIVTKKSTVEDLQLACSFTADKASKASLARMYSCRHSPIRTQIFYVEMYDIPTYVSVHLVRHKIGCEHFVKSNRGKDAVITRDTPVNHLMLMNAESLMNLAHARLCYKSDVQTVSVMRKIREAMEAVDSDLVSHLIPICVYRNGICPELTECRPGLKNVLGVYNE